MKEDLGIIMFDGKMYNLDKMSSSELEDLLNKMKANYNKLEKEVEVLTGVYN